VAQANWLKQSNNIVCPLYYNKEKSVNIAGTL